VVDCSGRGKRGRSGAAARSAQPWYDDDEEEEEQEKAEVILGRRGLRRGGVGGEASSATWTWTPPMACAGRGHDVPPTASTGVGQMAVAPAALSPRPLEITGSQG
jgi:hypothetical protein